MSMNEMEYKSIHCAARDHDLEELLRNAVKENWSLHSVIPLHQSGGATEGLIVVLFRSAPSQHRAGFPVGGAHQ